MKKSAKPQKLNLSRETIRRLAVTELSRAAGGLSGDRCSDVQTGCPDCHDRPSLTNTVCYACNWTDRCTDGCSEGFPCKFPE
jgi:hypothetical protein